MTSPSEPGAGVGGQLPTEGDGADERDSAADQRDEVAAVRDNAADLRDRAARRRDLASGSRDAAADHRDALADRRDVEASRHQHHVDAGERPAPSREAAAARFAAARRAAALDREQAAQDRRDGVQQRAGAERDRDTAHTDRSFGATGRERAGEDRSASARERRDASLDALTGTYVRGPGLLQLEREVLRAHRTGQSVTVAFLDVDGLKAVNDSGGHAAGDRLLTQVAAALRTRLRPYDLVVRYGGDEFVCVLAGAGQAESEQRFALVNADLAGHGSVSVGVVTAEPDESWAELLSRADAALYLRRAHPH